MSSENGVQSAVMTCRLTRSACSCWCIAVSSGCSPALLHAVEFSTHCLGSNTVNNLGFVLSPVVETAVGAGAEAASWSAPFARRARQHLPLALARCDGDVECQAKTARRCCVNSNLADAVACGRKPGLEPLARCHL